MFCFSASSLVDISVCQVIPREAVSGSITFHRCHCLGLTLQSAQSAGASSQTLVH